jgi:hypothetical protein
MAIQNNLISLSDFTGELALGIVSGSNQELVLNQIIDRQQRDYMTSLLGAKEYNKLMTELGSGTTPTTTKWVNFVSGTTLAVTDGGVSRSINYLGVREMLKHICYSYYLRWNFEINTNSGNVEKKTANSTIKNPATKITFHFQQGASYYGKDWANLFLINYDTMFFFKEYEKYSATCYNYLYWMNIASASNFPDWDWLPVYSINSYSI